MFNNPQAKTKFEEYINDWNKFCFEYLNIRLDNEQQEVLYSCQVNPKTAVASGTSRGKDYVAAAAGICFLYLTPRWNEKGIMIANTKVALSAPTERQVKNIMTPEITRIKNGSVYLPGWLTGNDIRTPYKEWFLTGFKADDTNTEAWTGFHAANVMFILTEASGFPQQVFDAIEGNLQGNSRLLIVANPNINTGYFASAMKSPAFKKFRLNSLNATNVKEKAVVIPGQVDYIWVKDRIKDWCTVILENEVSEIEADFKFEGVWYRPNDLFRAKVLGRFPKVSEGSLVPEEWIRAANDRWQKAQVDNITDGMGNAGSTAKVTMLTKSLRLGLDVAGMGRDSSAFAHRYGPYVHKFELVQSGGVANHMEIVGKTVTILKANLNTFSGRYPQVFVDTIGEGAGVFSRIVEIAQSTEKKAGAISYTWLSDKAHSVKASAGAEWNEMPLKDATGQYEFLNLRAYLYWSIRDWLNPDNKTGAMLPPDEELLQELTETKWQFMSNGKIKIEPKEELKERIKRSPDKADSLANTFYPVPDVDPRPAEQRSVAGFFR